MQLRHALFLAPFFAFSVLVWPASVALSDPPALVDLAQHNMSDAPDPGCFMAYEEARKLRSSELPELVFSGEQAQRYLAVILGGEVRSGADVSDLKVLAYIDRRTPLRWHVAFLVNSTTDDREWICGPYYVYPATLHERGLLAVQEAEGIAI